MYLSCELINTFHIYTYDPYHEDTITCPERKISSLEMASAPSNLVSAIRFYVDKIIADTTIGGMFLFYPRCSLFFPSP